IQVPIPASLVLGLVPDKLVNEPLVNAPARQRRNETVTQHMPATHLLPSSSFHRAFKSLVHRLRRHDLRSGAEQQTNSVAIGETRPQRLDKTVAQRHAAGGTASFDPLLLADRNEAAGKVNVLGTGTHDLAAASAAVRRQNESGIDP